MQPAQGHASLIILAVISRFCFCSCPSQHPITSNLPHALGALSCSHSCSPNDRRDNTVFSRKRLCGRNARWCNAGSSGVQRMISFSCFLFFFSSYPSIPLPFSRIIQGTFPLSFLFSLALINSIRQNHPSLFFFPCTHQSHSLELFRKIQIVRTERGDRWQLEAVWVACQMAMAIHWLVCSERNEKKTAVYWYVPNAGS